MLDSPGTLVRSSLGNQSAAVRCLYLCATLRHLSIVELGLPGSTGGFKQFGGHLTLCSIKANKQS